MSDTDEYNYQRIAAAITYLRNNFRSQPDLENVAAHVNMSPFHFQRLFTEWAGVSPKKFLQYLNIEHLKLLLRQRKLRLSEAAEETGLSGTGRLHDLFVNIEGMTPGEYKNGGINLSVNYSFSESPFGRLLIATTSRGICCMIFVVNEEEALADLQSRFPKATFLEQRDNFQDQALKIFSGDRQEPEQIRLHLRGTTFQIKVWEALLKIPMGELGSYVEIADLVGNPRASRAVGTAIGSNPVAVLIPCHRVIQNSGGLGGYRWGLTRKSALIGWESCQVNPSESV